MDEYEGLLWFFSRVHRKSFKWKYAEVQSAVGVGMYSMEQQSHINCVVSSLHCIVVLHTLLRYLPMKKRYIKWLTNSIQVYYNAFNTFQKPQKDSSSSQFQNAVYVLIGKYCMYSPFEFSQVTVCWSSDQSDHIYTEDSVFIHSISQFLKVLGSVLWEEGWP